MKKEPKAVYIIENGEYTELTYEEFCRREQICPLYAEKLFLPLYGSLMEVSKKDYEEYYRQRNRQSYIDRRASRNGDVSYNALTTDEFNGEDILIDFLLYKSLMRFYFLCFRTSMNPFREFCVAYNIYPKNQNQTFHHYKTKSFYWLNQTPQSNHQIPFEIKEPHFPHLYHQFRLYM